MQVVTLTPAELEVHSALLAKAVEEGSDTHYDAIVAVMRGGAHICDAFLRHFPQSRYGMRADISLQRPSTKRKEGKLGRILKHLPYPILDAMRMAESMILTLGRKIKSRTLIVEAAFPDSLTELLSEKGNVNVLVIDDAIDSGDTLSAIAATIRKKNPDARVRVAVITETTPNPRIRADYTLYRNRTLIRFPWSNDYKNR